MSNKGKENLEHPAGKKPLAPKLRFPEFHKTGGWKSLPIGAIYSFMATNSFPRGELSHDTGGVKNIHYGDIHTRFAASFDILRERVPCISSSKLAEGRGAGDPCAEGAMVFSDASEDREGVGKSVEIVRLNGERVVAGSHTILARQRTPRLVVGFGAHLFRSPLVRGRIQTESQGAKVFGISPGRLARVEIPLPPEISEQKKIADCLSSLDDLIAAEAQKLDALKSHKKALMQQLFPRESEAVPRLRFPEFRKAGEWERRRVGDVFSVTRGEVLPMGSVRDAQTTATPYPVFSSKTENGGLAGFYSEYLYEDAITWTTDGANAGDVNFRRGKFYCTNVCGVLATQSGYANPCTAALIGRTSRRHVSYVGNPKLMNGAVERMVVPFPALPEQKKIADCLSSLDDLIAAESQKFDALKSHKKALMQQLFPSPDEVPA